MNIHDYKYITTIAELGSFTSAAKQLYIAQPSLSQRVKHIEDDYGIIIFIRDSKTGIHLTPDGERFVEYAKKILQTEEDLRQAIADSHKEETNILRVGCTQFMDSFLFDKIMNNYYDKYPNVHFEFVQKNSSAIQDELLAGNIDVAICYHPTKSPEIGYETLMADRFVLVPSKYGDLEEKLDEAGITPYTSIPPEMLENEPLAVSDRGTVMYRFVTDMAQLNGIELNIQHYSRNYRTLYRIADAGIASAIVVQSFFDPAEKHDPYYFINTDHDDLALAAMWKKTAFLPKIAKNFITIAKKTAKEK